MSDERRAKVDRREDVEPDATPKKVRLEGRFWKILRVAAYASTVCAVVGVLAARSAYGDMAEGALEMGAELGKLGDIGAETPIILNGQPIHVGSSVHELSLSETLDRAETLCEGAAGPGQKQGAAVDRDGQEDILLDTGGKPAMGVVRKERDGQGVVFCFAPKEGDPGPQGVGERLDRWLTFMKTGDLDALGRLRYLYAKETDSGNTHLIRVWTDAPFNLFAMTSLDGSDAPGTDPADTPRPPESRRLLSATVDTAIYASRVYESRLSPSEIADAYDRMMPERGWSQKVRNGDVRVYQRRDVSVFVTPTEHEGHSLVSLLHMGHEPAVAHATQ